MNEQELEKAQMLNDFSTASITALSIVLVIIFVCSSIAISNINQCIEKGIFPDALLATNSCVKTQYSTMVTISIAYLIAYLVIKFK